MNPAFQPQIILLREGTDTSQGKSQIISNINACQAVAETVRTTLGPRGMDKLIFDGQRVTISNDGATIMRLLDIVHPAAKSLVEISMAQVSIFKPEFLNFISNVSNIHEFLFFRMLKSVMVPLQL
jgi:TCP-1/cpn60 chaperonin family